MFEEGTVVVVPVETTTSPLINGGYDIKNIRCGIAVQWYPQHVKVRLYDERKGRHEEIVVAKAYAAVIENPLYSVMNETNSTLKRLVRKLSILDVIDEQSGSGKLDLIIQLPYVIKSEARRVEAEKRRKSIEMQLKGSQYGIAYTDGTEKITQLNRPSENNLLKQVEFLTNMLYAELGLTTEVMNGTADEATMLNYYNRTIEPIVSAITEEFNRTFLTKTARSQKQAVISLRNPFKLMPMSVIAEVGDKLARNEAITSNEIRNWIGLRPSKDPKADKLVNSNMPETPPASDTKPAVVKPSQTEGNSQNGTQA